MMNIETLKERLRELILPIMDAMGYELQDVELLGKGGRFLLRVIIDKDGGVTLNDCEKASREIGAMLDVEDPIPSSYVLEVSSPGLDRPLRNPGDFNKYVGNMARVITYEPIENQTFFVGKIIEARETDVVLLLPKERIIAIPYSNISRARLEIEF